MERFEALLKVIERIVVQLSPYFEKFEFDWLISVIVVIGALLILRLLFISRETRKLVEITNDDEIAERIRRKKVNFSYFAKLKSVLILHFRYKEKKHLADVVYFSIILVEVAFFLFFLFNGIPLLAIGFPIVIHFLLMKIFEVSTVTIHDHIRKELPNIIKHMTKVLSQTSDLKSVIHQTSLDINEPLRKEFFELSRRMITENEEKVLMEFAKSMDNTWMYAFVFLLTSYKEDSKKDDIIKNLNVLANMVDKENYVREKSITDKKFLVIMNYIILVVAVALSIGSFFFNPMAMVFFFESILGMICFLLGVAALLATVLVNVMMMNPKE